MNLSRAPIKPLFILVRHVPTMEDDAGLLTPATAPTRVKAIDLPALERVARLVDDVAEATRRDVSISLSPTDRSRATCRALRDMLAVTASSAEDPRLLNIDQGGVAGLTQDEFRRKPLYWQWHVSPEHTIFPGGEGLAEVSRRVDAFASSRAMAESIQVVISHTTPLQVFLARCLDLPTGTIWRFYFAYYAATVVYGSVLLSANSTESCGSWLVALRD